MPAQEPMLACHAAPAQPQSNGVGDELSCEDIQYLLQDPLPAQQVFHNAHPIYHRLDTRNSETNMQSFCTLQGSSCTGRSRKTLTLTPQLAHMS